MNPPDATYGPDRYTWLYPQWEIEVVFEHMHEDSRDGLRGDLTISTGRHPMPGVLFSGRVSLSLPSQQQSVLRALGLRTTHEFLQDVDFSGILVQVEIMAKRRYRLGAPAVRLVEVQPAEKPRWLLYPYLQTGAVTVLYGDGGTGKTSLALAMCLEIASVQRIVGSTTPAVGGNVLYLDWETESETHAEILSALCAAHNMPVPGNIWYRRMYTSLAAGIVGLQHEVAVNGITMIVVDSIGMAGGDEPEKAAPKIALFNAIRRLDGVTILAIDHVAKPVPGTGTKTPRGPYGSVYTRNIARIAWEISKSQEEETSTLNVSLRMEKINRGRMVRRQGFTLTYDGDDNALTALHIKRVDPMEIPSFRLAAPLANRIAATLRYGAMSLPALIETLEEDGSPVQQDSVLKALRRGSNIFQPLDDGYWGLKV